MEHKIKIDNQHVNEPEWLYSQDIVYHDYGECKRHLQVLFPYKREWEEGENPIVSVENSRLLYEQLKETHHAVEYYELENCDAHGGLVFYCEEVLNIIQEFCNM